MKKLLLIPCLFLAACGNDGKENAGKKNFTPPKSGTVIAADSTRIAEDNLNEQYFAVSIVATDSSISGTYDVEAHWGFNNAVNSFKMPYGGEHYTPILKRGTEPYSFVVGFHFDDDTLFHEYYGIEAQRGQMQMKYLKAYTLQ